MCVNRGVYGAGEPTGAGPGAGEPTGAGPGAGESTGAFLGRVTPP